MSRKYVRRFIRYHPGLFQDRSIILSMSPRYSTINLRQLSRIIVRYRKAKSSDYLVLQLRVISDHLQVDFREILALNRINASFGFCVTQIPHLEK